MNNIIEISNVRKIYGKGDSQFAALSGVSLKIREGESVAIVGKSGSGKSTLMHILALLDKPTTGTICINCEDATSIKERKLNSIRNQLFGFVFQQFFINANHTVLDNVMLPLKIAGVPAKERKQRAMAVLKEVELEEKAKEKANNLSGGQKQRVCVARALIGNPKIIFADEPTGNLDSSTGERIEHLLFDLNERHGITLIIVTHDDELAARCDRQIHIKDGMVMEA
jgi:putative ABC transport system ATP-binding protein